MGFILASIPCNPSSLLLAYYPIISYQINNNKNFKYKNTWFKLKIWNIFASLLYLNKMFFIITLLIAHSKVADNYFFFF